MLELPQDHGPSSSPNLACMYFADMTFKSYTVWDLIETSFSARWWEITSKLPLLSALRMYLWLFLRV